MTVRMRPARWHKHDQIGLRDARAHFGRFVMSIIAIALGVSFVVGSFCFREMMNNQVSDMMGTSADHDVYVRGSKEVKSDSSGLMAASSSSKTYNTINVDLASTIGDVKGVKSAEVVYSVSGTVLVGKDGAAVSTMGAPTLAVGFGKDVPCVPPHSLRAHTPPRTTKSPCIPLPPRRRI